MHLSFFNTLLENFLKMLFIQFVAISLLSIAGASPLAAVSDAKVMNSIQAGTAV